MDYSITFARHFARLVWLLLNEPASVDEQKGVLRALVTIAKEGFVTLGIRAGQLTANGTALPSALSGVPEVVARMTSHGLPRIDVSGGATAADLLGAARMLASESMTGPVSRGGSVRYGATPDASLPAVSGGVRAAALPPLDFGEVIDDPLPPVTSPAASPADPLSQLDSETSAERLPGVLDDLAVRAEEAMREERPAAATEILYRIVRRERDVQELGLKRAFVLTVKRLATPALLRAVVAELASSPETRQDSLAALARAGEEGADVLIERLAAEEGRAERRVCFDALVQLQAGIPTLIHMLGDPRWYVARNAAALLGEMQAREAELPLVALLHHDDERVRHAATLSLMRLGTPRSLQTIQEALKDVAPQIRMQAAASLVGRQESNVTELLLRALDDERDDEAQAAFLLALGQVATPEAVERLIATAEPDRALFRKRSVALRVAAVQALAEARTPEALRALKALQGDRDEDVRATAVYVLGRRERR
jgi:hypothetical protein